MDYVIGSVAALISGNVTPNRPKLVRRALTPTKHQPSPNVTPKSEFVEDRSIFLSPTQQKKKAIVKKSPKRIFENPDLDVTEDSEGNSSQVSPKAEKVKKHLKEELDADDMGKKKFSMPKSPSSKLDKSADEVSLMKKSKTIDNSQVSDTPKKKKKRESNITEKDNVRDSNDNATSESVEMPDVTKTNVKTTKKKQRKSVTEIQTDDKEPVHVHSPITQETSISNTNTTSVDTTTMQSNKEESKKSKKRKKKNKKAQNVQTNAPIENKESSKNAMEPQIHNKNKKNRKNKVEQAEQKSKAEVMKPLETEKMDVDNESESDSEKVKSRNIPNPKAITEKDSDSEHDSDDEIESENEQENEKILTNENQQEESSDEEEPESSSKKKRPSNQPNEDEEVMTEEDVKRTLFVGNVRFSNKCKKEIKKIFAKYGPIDTIRIRTIPVKDARVTPKLAVIKNELHPERTTVNVYVKYADAASVKKALNENNTVLNGNHLRVTPSESTGAEHDSRCAVFVGNMPFAIEDDTLRSKFENCGEITSVRIIRDKKTNAGKGFGYVNFASKDGVELALALSEEDLTIKNRILRVKRCTQQKPGGKPAGGGKWGSKDQGQGNRGGQVQGGKWDGQAQGGGKWGGQEQSGREWGGRGGGNISGRGGGNRGGRGGGNRGGRGGVNRGGRGAGNRGGFGGGNRGGYGGGNREEYTGGNRGGYERGNRGGYERGNRGGYGGGNRGGQGQGGGNWGGQGQSGGKLGNQEEGAARRLMNKRKQQDGASEGPPNKRQKDQNQPAREKKPRKEFVGMTAEKKKKPKLNKEQKKKKVISEILAKV